MSRSLWKSLKRHASFLPLYLLSALGFGGAIAFGIRTALQNPDVQWKRGGEISNEDYRKKQFKLYSPGIDYSKLESPAPNYQELN